MTSPSVRLTAAERRALAVLDPAIPRHPEDVWRRDRVRLATLHRLATASDARPALARRLELKPACWLKTPYTPFYVLTDAGVAVRDGKPLS